MSLPKEGKRPDQLGVREQAVHVQEAWGWPFEGRVFSPGSTGVIWETLKILMGVMSRCSNLSGSGWGLTIDLKTP